MLQELRTDLAIDDMRGRIRERLREYADVATGSPVERTDSAWRIVQNVLAEELLELNASLGGDAQVQEKDRLALPDGSQAIDVVYRGHKFSIMRPKDRRSLYLLDPSAGRLPIERVGPKLFIAGEPIAAALLASIARLVERATAGVNSDPGLEPRYMALEMLSSNAAKVEAALNLATENGFRFVESYRTPNPHRRVFVFERSY
ncbi:MAG TPA: hypothetical protein VEJ20_06935 [Candidatus Eremiobacteraceae bacterium]|nr:hypothetical protein [Candidatus Eremiobacteraceae bacterium]